MTETDRLINNKMIKMNIKKPRKMQIVKPSKYDMSGALNVNKEYWNEVFEKMEASYTNPTEIKDSGCLSQVLPSELYKKVCSTLDMPVIEHEVVQTKQVTEKKPRRLIKEPLINFRTTLHIDREAESDTDVEYQSESGSVDERRNFYREFLKKPEREQITWNTHYLLPERDDEKGLVKKADDLTDSIVNKFCEYMNQLGGNQQSQLFTPEAVKELFQIEFDYHVARSLRVIPKVLTAVTDKIAEATGNPDQSYQAVLNREILKDIKAESRPDNLLAFSRSLPPEDRWRAPRNDTKLLWRSARLVPQDLVSLKTVWEGITNLRSVKEYCRWMIDHPEHQRAPYLSSLGMFDQAVLEARRTLDQKDLAILNTEDAPTSIDHLRKRLSELSEE